ncbi:MAG: biopolymer transporter ExbD [Scytolyngbya sp. HA4215-MV1]|jgi:biopolymer transport protein ExbD|nr:biopolymer transporter ExbD [Scytolyngbya sp. HA4215-MV1]
MKIHLDTPAEEVQIQLIPLIDVIFCILTFFILAALQLTRPQSINVDLPTAKTGVSQMRETLVVTLSPSGQIYVDKEQVGLNQLYLLLDEYHRNNPNGLLVLNASQSALYNDVVQVLDLMRVVGGDRVALAVQPGNPNPAATTPLTPGAPNQFNPANPLGIPGSSNPSNSGQYQFPTNPGQSPGLLNPSTSPGSLPGASPNTLPSTAPGSSSTQPGGLPLQPPPPETSGSSN